MTSHMVADIFAELSRPKSAGHAPLRTCIEGFGYRTKSDANTGYEPNDFDKITFVDNDTMLINDPDHNISDFSTSTNENTDNPMFSQCSSRRSCKLIEATDPQRI